MAQEYIVKTVSQYNRESIPEEVMRQLCEIAEGYCAVKNLVFERYGGIRSLPKLYPGYTIQNELTKSGIRQQMGLPSVYFYLAMFDALAGIKAEWTRIKKCVSERVQKNENFREEERHYLRFALKVDGVFQAVLNGEEIVLPEELARPYEAVKENVEAERLNRYLDRQVRRNHRILHSAVQDGFSATERAYRYEDGGIYLATKRKRQRVFIPLTDTNRYQCQIYVKLDPAGGNLEIRAPIKRRVRQHEDYRNEVGIALGMTAMLTTDQGHVYGEEFGSRQTAYAEWIRRQNQVHRENVETGRKKYLAQKNRRVEELHSYINQELNRFLREERPGCVYIAKLPKAGPRRGKKEINYFTNMWQRGYIRQRLEQKCAEESVELTNVFGKGISQECSRCGSPGRKGDGWFVCESCGYRAEEKRNTAANSLKRGRQEKITRVPTKGRQR